MADLTDTLYLREDVGQSRRKKGSRHLLCPYHVLTTLRVMVRHLTLFQIHKGPGR